MVYCLETVCRPSRPSNQGATLLIKTINALTIIHQAARFLGASTRRGYCKMCGCEGNRALEISGHLRVESRLCHPDISCMVSVIGIPSPGQAHSHSSIYRPNHFQWRRQDFVRGGTKLRENNLRVTRKNITRFIQ